jgi:hypothetical protein
MDENGAPEGAPYISALVTTIASLKALDGSTQTFSKSISALVKA